MESKVRTPQEELEDVLWGLEHGIELEATSGRLLAVRCAMNILAYASHPDYHVLVDMYNLWNTGHGVLPHTHRIEVLKRAIQNLSPRCTSR